MTKTHEELSLLRELPFCPTEKSSPFVILRESFVNVILKEPFAPVILRNEVTKDLAQDKLRE